ncbi:MAG: O-acetyl-ADP-ribose deacetylase [Bdellovibrionota bacterium]
MPCERTIAKARVALVQGDITKHRADALVTAANAGLRGGGGVDGAIHRAAGPRLLDACRKIGGCETGSAVLTPAFDLEKRGVKYVIHAVGPIWGGGTQGESDLLHGAYLSSLELAAEAACRSIAFPSISTGVYGFPVAKAAPLAIETVGAFLRGDAGSLEVVTFCLFDGTTYEHFEAALGKLQE